MTTKKPEKKAIIIIGAGHFGQRAAALLNSAQHSSLWIVDRDVRSLNNIGAIGAKRIAQDGVHFLVKHFSHLAPSTFIIPAVPVHLAFEWLKTFLNKGATIKRISVPKDFAPRLPHTWKGADGSLLVSYADFQCPEDCPEPAAFCTVTGKKRGIPLYGLLARLEPQGFRMHVIRSQQLAPGVGGYRVRDLKELLGRVSEGGEGKWLVGTACKCHGVITALQVAQ